MLRHSSPVGSASSRFPQILLAGVIVPDLPALADLVAAYHGQQILDLQGDGVHPYPY